MSAAEASPPPPVPSGAPPTAKSSTGLKVFAIGCGVLALVVLIGGGVAGYFVIRTAKAKFQQVVALTELDEQVANTRQFTPPRDGELTEETVRRFVAVQDRMLTRLGTRAQEIQEKIEAIEARLQRENREAGVREGLFAWGEILSLVVEAKRAQVDALNEQGFSLDEYHWARARFYSATGVQMPEVPLGQLASGSADPDALMLKPIGSGVTTSPREQELVAPYVEKVENWAVISFFGL